MYWGRSVELPSVFFWVLGEQAPAFNLPLLFFPHHVSPAYPVHRPIGIAAWLHVTVWDSHAQSKAREETVSHAEMVRKLNALVDDPSRKRVFHTRFTNEQDLPLACIEAPITEFDITILQDMESLPARERLAESIMSRMRTSHLEGLLSMARGFALEDESTILYLAGWNSIEVCASRLR
jgi:hypothetical protein